jgi:archaellum biogenesis ATPase FlaH
MACALPATNVLQFVQNYDKVSFSAAVEIVKQAGGSNWESQKATVDRSFQSVAAPKDYVSYPVSDYRKYEQALADSPEALGWLKNRGIDHACAQRLRIGFRQDVGKLAGKDSDIAARGWLVFPCIEGDRVVSMAYRSIVEKKFCRQPKMKTALFGAESIDPLEPIWVVEGEPDRAALDMVGIRAVALPGAATNITPEMKDQLMSADSIVLAGDNDDPGRQCMSKLLAALEEKAVMITWPEGTKDANEVFLKTCGQDKTKFKEMLEGLVATAKSSPMKNVYSLQETMKQSPGPVIDSPNRLPFPWPEVNDMVNVLPGNVLAITATGTGQGKSTLVMNILVDLVKTRPNWCILNYSAELTPHEYGEMVTSYLLRKDRRKLTPEDGKVAAKMLGDHPFYIGRDPDATRMDQALTLIESAIKRLGATVLVIDTFHSLCVNESDQIRAQENAIRRITDMTARHGLITIIVLQPRKATQDRKGKQLHISDSRGAAAILEACHAALFMHREQKEEGEASGPDPWKPLTKIELKKGRSLGMGNCVADLISLGEFCRFVPAAFDQLPTPKDSVIF